MEKKEFIKPAIEVIYINDGDIITASGLTNKNALDNWLNDDGNEDWTL